MSKVKLILIRGLPGSGKTTLAKKMLKPGWKHFEADFFHVDDDGVYRYKEHLINEAHSWCLDMATCAIEEGYSVIVSNTFVTRRSLQPYLYMAKDYGIPVQVICCTGKFKNVHNVPNEIIEKMKLFWQIYEEEEFK